VFSEPLATTVFLLSAGVLFVVSVVLSGASHKIGVPIALIFLLLGMLAGSEGIGGIVFGDYQLMFRLGTSSLVMILFDGGLNTSWWAVKKRLLPASLLATLGVLITAALVALLTHTLGFTWYEALLIGAIVSSTDAASVFSVLRSSGINLKERVSSILELESGLNDPMAIILATALTQAIATSTPLDWMFGLHVLREFAIGAFMGLCIGALGRFIFAHIKLSVSGLYPVLSTGLAFLAFGVPSLFYGSGFIAVYLAAAVVGNGKIPYRQGLFRVHDAIAWFCQVAMFLMLGLLIFPSRLMEVAPWGLSIALFLAFVARPLAVALCLLPFRFATREILYLGWVGLRGAVPIIICLIPVLAKLPKAELIFHLVFFVVVINAVIPGATVRWLTRFLKLEFVGAPKPPAVLEINSLESLRGEVLPFFIQSGMLAAQLKIAELPFPEGAAAMLIVREQEMIAPNGETLLREGDHLYVFCKPEDRQFVQLLFGAPQG
jgi:potassium/hydrogen antiporter